MPAERHAEKSPSSFPQWDLCPCYKSGPVGHAAKEGTRKHNVLEKMLRGETVEADDATIEEMSWVYEQVFSIAKANNITPKDILIEEEVHVTDDDLEEITFGTLDIAFLDIIIDYKSGEIRNYKPQMAVYALARMQATGMKNLKVIEIYGRYRKTVPYELAIAEAHKIVFDINAKIDDPNKQPTENKYCGWCSKKSTCEVFVKPVKTVIKAVLPLSSKKISELVKKELPLLSPNELSFLVAIAQKVKEWSKTIEEHALASMIAGTTLPGYHIKEKPGNQFLTDHKKAMEAAGLNYDDLKDNLEPTITHMGKVLAKKEAMTQKEGKEELIRRISDYVSRKKPTPKIERD